MNLLSWLRIADMWGKLSNGKDGFEWKNPHQGCGMTNHPRNYKCAKSAKAKAKNRAGKKARKANRRKK